MIRRHILSLMLLATLHAALLPAVPALAETKAASTATPAAKAASALARVKTFDDAVSFFYAHQLPGMGGAMATFLGRHGVSPQAAFPRVSLARDRVEAPALKWPLLVKSTRPLILRYGSSTWTPDSTKSPVENLDSLFELLVGPKSAASGLFDGSWLIPSAYAYSKGEKVAMGVGAMFAVMLVAPYFMDAAASEAVTYASAFLMLGLGGGIAYVGGKSLTEAVQQAISKAFAGGNVPYLPSKVVSCSPVEVQFRRAEPGSKDTFTMREDTKADGTPGTVSYLDGKGSPLAGVGGPYPVAQRKVSPGSSNLRWIWSKEADEGISARLGLPKGIRIDPATLEDAVKKPENKEFAGKIGSGTLFFDTWQRVCAPGASVTMEDENRRLGLLWKNADKAVATTGHSGEDAPAGKEPDGGATKAE